MARTYAAIQCAIWRDEEFTSLTLEQQGLYLTLCAHPRLLTCGVLDYTLYRLAKGSAANTDEVARVLDALVEAGFVVLDEETGELLVRSFVRYSGNLGMPNLVKNVMFDRTVVVESDRLRDLIDAEIHRACQEGLMDRVMQTKIWPEIETADEGYWKAMRNGRAIPSGNPSEKGSTKGSRKPSRNPSRKGGE